MAKKCNVISVQMFQVQVCEALGLDPMEVKRIIIDLDAANGSDPMPVYVEMVADKSILSLDWNEGLKKAKVIREPKETSNLPRIGDVKMFCRECDWRGTVYDCEPDVGGDGSLRCPDCHTVVEEWKDLE